MQISAASPAGGEGSRARLVAVLLVAAPLAGVPALAWLAPSPREALRLVTGLFTGHITSAGTGSPDPTAPLVAGAAAAAWACSAWLALVVLVSLGERLPGTAGQMATAATARLAPAPVRALVRLAVGVTMVGAVLGGSPALAADHAAEYATEYATGYATPAPTPPSPAPQLDWPGAPVLPAPSAPAPSPPATSRPAAAVHHARPVVVEPGDSLWAIAARDLGPRATPARVAQAWPEWWQANRAVLGPDPDLIFPGTSLEDPTPNTRRAP